MKYIIRVLNTRQDQYIYVADKKSALPHGEHLSSAVPFDTERDAKRHITTMSAFLPRAKYQVVPYTTKELFEIKLKGIA